MWAFPRGKVKAESFVGVGAGESSASTTTEINTSFATPSTTKRKIVETKYGDQNLWRLPVNLLIFFYVSPSDFRFVTWFMSILKFGLPRLSFEVFQTKTKLFWAISVSSKRIVKSNDFKLLLSRQTSQRNHVLNYAAVNGLATKQYSKSFSPS